MGKTDQNHSTRVVMANLKAVMVVINNKDTNKDTILDMADMVRKVVTTSKHKGMVVTTNKHRVITPTNNKDSMVLNNPDMEVMDITNKDTDNSNKAMVSNNKDKMVNKARTDSKDMDNS